MTNVPSVDELITESRNAKLRAKKKKIIKFLITLIVIIVLVFCGYFYFNSKFSVLSKIVVHGNQNISRNVVETSINKVKSRFSILDLGFTLSSELELNPLLKSLKIQYLKSNELNITVEEYQVLAYLENINSVLLENGSLYSFDDFEPIPINELIYVTGYTDELAYTRLAESLNSISSSTKLMISEIIQDKKDYNVYYAKLIMYDGIIVYTSLSTLKVLDDYASIRKALNPDHTCIAIDEIKSVPYSFSCYP